jgi:hypothetical protein
VDLGTTLPVAYLNFLRLTNGLDWNGVVVYASETTPLGGHVDRSISGIVDMNLGLRADERFDDLLVFGSNGLDLYTLRLSTRVYETYDEVPHEPLDTFGTFDGLLTGALTRSLQ